MATNTGTDNIDIAPENDDFEAVDVQTNDDDTGDTTGQGEHPRRTGRGRSQRACKLQPSSGAEQDSGILWCQEQGHHFRCGLHPTIGGSGQDKPMDRRPDLPPVSYTHLTLPTIYSV